MKNVRMLHTGDVLTEYSEAPFPCVPNVINHYIRCSWASKRKEQSIKYYRQDIVWEDNDGRTVEDSFPII
jgi:hypothetical protein